VGRVLLILILACLVATFFIINNATFKPATTSASPKKEEAKSKPEKEHPAKKREKESSTRISRKATGERAPRSNSAAAAEAKAVASVSDEVEVVQDRSHATVKGDSTPVYSINSKDSSVVKMLNKGDRVSTDLEVIDVQGRWMIVKKNDLSKPGFVERDELQTANATKKKDTKR